MLLHYCRVSFLTSYLLGFRLRRQMNYCCRFHHHRYCCSMRIVSIFTNLEDLKDLSYQYLPLYLSTTYLNVDQLVYLNFILRSQDQLCNRILQIKKMQNPNYYLLLIIQQMICPFLIQAYPHQVFYLPDFSSKHQLPHGLLCFIAMTHPYWRALLLYYPNHHI